MRKTAFPIRTLLVLSTLALLLPAMPALASLSDTQCGGYSYVACNGDHVTVIELCNGGTVEVTNGEVTLLDDSTWEVEQADRVEIQEPNGRLWTFEGDVQICRQ